MKIRIYDPAADRRFIGRNGLIEASLDELWRESDVITCIRPWLMIPGRSLIPATIQQTLCGNGNLSG